MWQAHTERLLSADDAATLQQQAQGIARDLFLGPFGRQPELTIRPGVNGPVRFETA